MTFYTIKPIAEKQKEVADSTTEPDKTDGASLLATRSWPKLVVVESSRYEAGCVQNALGTQPK